MVRGQPSPPVTYLTYIQSTSYFLCVYARSAKYDPSRGQARIYTGRETEKFILYSPVAYRVLILTISPDKSEL